MKKYTSRATKWFALFSIISVLTLLMGIVFIVVDVFDVVLQVGLMLSGGYMSIFFLICFFAGKSRWLAIDTDTIILPRGTNHNGRKVLKRTIIKTDEIISLESEFYKGDKIVSNDCFFYTLKLKDGAKITFTLYDYGKEAEKEIVKTIKRGIF